MSSEDTVFEPGDVVADRYEIAEELGRGSYGVVYRAIQLGIGRDVALKTLLPHTPVDSEEHQRFEREALVVSRFNHPNIVTLFDYGEHDGVLFMVMEYIEGRTLREVIDEDTPLEPQRIRAIIGQILDALQYAHGESVVHRDLKPANIQLIENPSMDTEQSELVKVLDFGIAKIVHGEEEAGALDTLTQTGIAMGTPQYMSPENITGDPVTHHADLYALGLVLYEMLTGDVVFEGTDPQEVMVAHIKDSPPELPKTARTRPFLRAVDWALKKQPDERVPTARRFREILQEDAPELPSSPSPPPSEEQQLVKPLAAVAMASSVVILLLVAMLFHGQNGESSVGETGVVVEQEDGSHLRAVEQLSDEMVIDDGAGADDGGVDLVTLEVISHPEGARVILDGDVVGSTPLSERIARGGEPIEIEVRGGDGRQVVREIVPDTSRTVEIELQ